MTKPTPKTEPVFTATLLAPVVAWLVVYFFPSADMSPEVATGIAGAVLFFGSWFARSRVRTKATLPDPTAVKPPPSAAPLLGGRRRKVRGGPSAE